MSCPFFSFFSILFTVLAFHLLLRRVIWVFLSLFHPLLEVRLTLFKSFGIKQQWKHRQQWIEGGELRVKENGKKNWKKRELFGWRRWETTTIMNVGSLNRWLSEANKKLKITFSFVPFGLKLIFTVHRKSRMRIRRIKIFPLGFLFRLHFY
jgi:hypothetical protein